MVGLQLSSGLFIISLLTYAALLICSSELALGNQPPAFLNLSSFVNVDEATAVGATILKLEATDVDDQLLTFTTEDQDTFGIRRTGLKTADVFLLKSLNYSVRSQYNVKFKVSDGTNSPTEKQCLILVKPSAYQPPTIVNLPKTVSVSEDAAVGTQVYQVQARDTTSIVAFSIQDPSTSKFAIDGSSGIVTTAGILDYHVQMTHQVTVVVKNRRNLGATGTLTIEVTGAKNRPPYFLESYFKVNASEGLPKGSSVFTVQAFDGNTDLPNDLTYTIVAAPLNLFAIDPRTGLVTTLNVLDCSLAEVKTAGSCTFNTVVQACEQPIKTMGSICSTILLAVSVADGNSHAPTFTYPSYDCYLSKFAPPSTPIGCNRTLSVRDEDTGDNAKFNLSVQPASALEWLTIWQSPGSNDLIVFMKNGSALAADSTNPIVLEVTAMETSTVEKLSGRATLIVHLLDSDGGCLVDDALKFTSDEYSAVANGAPQAGAPVVTVKAASKVAGDVVTYRMRGPYANVFSIDEKSGAISIARPDLVNSTKEVRAFPVTATSRSNPRLLALAVVLVRWYVPDSSTSSPPSSPTSISGDLISAMVGLNSNAGQLAARMPDAVREKLNGWKNPAPTTSYRCALTVYLCDGAVACRREQRGTATFLVDPDCTNVTFGVSLREAGRLNNLEIRTILMTLSAVNGSSGDDSRFLATVLLSVNPYSFPLDRPLFVPRGVDVRPVVRVTSPDRFLIGAVMAVDPLHLDRQVRFDLSASDPNLRRYFSINDTTGVVTMDKTGFDFSLSREIINLTVTAQSSLSQISNAIVESEPVRSETTTLTVRVEPCRGSSFNRVVIVAAVGTGVDPALVDLKDFTNDWQRSTAYSLSDAVPDVGKTSDLMAVDEAGLVRWRGLLPVPFGSNRGLKVTAFVSSPNCGERSSAEMLVFLPTDASLVRIVTGSPPEVLARTHKDLVGKMADVFGVWTFPYAIYRNINGTSSSNLLVYCIDPSTRELLSYSQFERSYNSVDGHALDKFRGNYSILSFEPYNGSLVVPFPSQSSGPNDSCLPLVVALAVLGALCFLAVLFAIVFYLCIGRRHKMKAKDVAISYSNTMAADYLGADKNRDEDKDSSTATSTTSNSSEFSAPTANSSARGQNFILRKPAQDAGLAESAELQRSGYDCDSLDRPPASQNQPGVVTHSLASLAPSKFSDSALGSSDNFSVIREPAPRAAPKQQPEQHVPTTIDDPSVLYAKVEHDQSELPSKYEALQSVLRLTDNIAGDSFYI